MSRKFTSSDRYEMAVQRDPEGYVACAFRGEGRFDRKDAPSFDAAVTAARQLYTDRPVIVYAVRGTKQSQVANVADEPVTPIYLIAYRDYLKDLTVYAAATPAIAAEMVTDVPNDLSVVVVGPDTAPDAISTRLLLDLYNQITDQTVARFASKANGLDRLRAALESRNLPVIGLPFWPDRDQPEEKKMTSEAKPEKPAKADKPRRERLTNAAPGRAASGAGMNRPPASVLTVKTKLRESSRRAQLLIDLQAGTYSPAQLLERHKLDRAAFVSYLKFYANELGIGSELVDAGPDRDQPIRARFPDGTGLEHVIAAPGERQKPAAEPKPTEDAA